MKRTAEPAEAAAAVCATDISTVREGRPVLRNVSLSVGAGEHWALLGPNGAGKSTLLGHLGAWRFPSRGTVRVAGRQLGHTDLRELRRLVGWVDPRLEVRPDLAVTELVLTGATATSEPVPRRVVSRPELDCAHDLMTLLGIAHLATRAVGTLSAGERGRALVARALLPRPVLLLLDEPMTGLDLPGRELLLGTLSALAASEPALASVLVTHHLEELPTSTTHAALLGAGELLAAGHAEAVLTSGPVSRAFGLPVEVTRHRGRWYGLAAAIPAESDAPGEPAQNS